MGCGARAADGYEHAWACGVQASKEGGGLSVSEMGDGHVGTHTHTHVHRKGTELGAEGGADPFRRLQHGTSME